MGPGPHLSLSFCPCPAAIKALAGERWGNGAYMGLGFGGYIGHGARTMKNHTERTWKMVETGYVRTGFSTWGSL